MIGIVIVLKGLVAMIVRMTDRTKAELGNFVLGFSSSNPIPAADIRLAEAAAAKTDHTVDTDDEPDVALARLIEAARNCEGMGIPLNDMSRAQLIQWALAA